MTQMILSTRKNVIIRVFETKFTSNKVIYFSDGSAAQYINYKNSLPCPKGKILVMVIVVL